MEKDVLYMDQPNKKTQLEEKRSHTILLFAQKAQLQ